MRPLYLTISGWGPYKDLVEIDFEKIQQTGLFLITGPTGAGKTTIFDAISYALYGNLSGDMREKGTVRSDFAGADVQTFVKLKMEHAGKVYLIERNPEYMRPKKRKSGEAEYTKEKENAILTYPDGKVVEGIKEVNAKLLDILVLDYNQFKQISMLAQGQFSKLLNAGSKEKVAIFREIFGTHIFDRFTTILRSRVRALEEESKEVRHKLEEALGILAGRNGAEDYEEGLSLRERMDMESIHYQSVLDILAKWEKAIQNKKKELDSEYEKLDATFRVLSAKEQAATELSQKFDRLEQVKRQQLSLQQQETEAQKWQQMIADAMVAAQVRVSEVSYEQALDATGQIVQKDRMLKDQYKRLQEESEELKIYGAAGEELAALLEIQVRIAEAESKLAAMDKNILQMKQRLEQEQKNYLALEAAKDAAKTAFDNADKAYKRGMVGIVAETMLTEGQACPVCGSLEHPHPATKAEDVPTEQELDELANVLAKKEAQFRECYNQLVEKQAQQESRIKECDMLKQQLAQFMQEKETCIVALEKKQAQQMLECLSDLTVDKVRSRQNRYAQMAGLLAGKEEELARSGESIQQAKAEQEEKEKTFLDILKEKKFESVDAYKAAFLPATKQEELQKKLQKYQEDTAATKQLLLHLEEELKGKERPDAEELKLQCRQAKIAREDKQARIQEAGSLSDAVRETKAVLKDKMQILEKVETKYGYEKDLEAMASGKNVANLVFEQYVLAGYFEEILRAANLRFSKMTGGRYEMARMEEATDARKKDSLEIEVMDYYTGKARPVKTLSGGESFKASLSLALGLSDVIQAMSGGIKVDVLFVDEGFGALDGESLDQACETMQSLVESNRMIGIISHVQELRERISNQIVVERTSGGSTVKVSN